MKRMSIDEAITHAIEVVKKNREDYKDCPANRDDIKDQTCEQCAEEHEQLAKWFKELKRYKDLEEQGLLLKLPCDYGTTVFVIPTKENGLAKTAEMKCLGFSVGEPCNVANLYAKNRSDKSIPKMYQPVFDDFGKTVFLTQEEAEKALQERNSDKGNLYD